MTEKKAQKALSIKELKLLNRVLSYYQHCLTQDGEKVNAFKDKLGVNDNQTLKDFGVGYVDGTLLDILPDDEAVAISLKNMGVLDHKNREVFYGRIVFPLYDSHGALTNLYGWSLEEQGSSPHLYLRNQVSGFVNINAVKRSQTVILTRWIPDAMVIYDQGFKRVMPLCGKIDLIQDHLSLFHNHIKEAYIVVGFQNEEEINLESIMWALNDKGISTHLVRLPYAGVTQYFQRHSPEEFENLLRKVNPEALELSEKVNKRIQSMYSETEQGFIVGYGDRQYEIKGIQRGNTQLKATIKASKDLDKSSPFELNTIDLYSSRSRILFSKQCAILFDSVEELIREDLDRILQLVETYQPITKDQIEAESTKEEKKQALDFLKDPDIFSQILADFEDLGVTGEETNKLVGYLGAVSRKLEEPLSILIQSRSAAGKSTLQDAILSLVPNEDYIKYTRITDQALFYKGKASLVHKILAIEEEEGMAGAAYSIRSIQSSKGITVATTGKDLGSGKMKTEEYTVKGPVAVIITTTASELEGEMASRFLFLTIDESSKMTEAIHQVQRREETLDGLIRKKRADRIIRKHHAAQRLLRSLHIVNPFTPYLSYPSHSLRTRRDHKKYLSIIRAIAFLYQFQKEIRTVDMGGEPVEYIEVSLEDIDRANNLASEVLGQSLDEMSKPSRTLLSYIHEMVKDISEKQSISLNEVYFTRRMIREYTGWSDWQVRSHIKQLEQMEYVHVRVGSKGKEYAYALAYQGKLESNVPEHSLNLTHVEEIQRMISESREGTG